MSESNVWEMYINPSKHHQEFTSERASLKHVPRTSKLLEHEINVTNKTILDIGCGKYNLLHDFATNLGANFNGIDPYNQTHEHNISIIDKCSNGKSDIVLVTNVLNTIQEVENHEIIIQQAHDALKPDGELYVVIFEGARTTEEKAYQKRTGKRVERSSFQPVVTRDSFQQRKPTKWYLPTVTKMFPNAKIVNFKNGGKMIVATKSVGVL